MESVSNPPLAETSFYTVRNKEDGFWYVGIVHEISGFGPLELFSKDGCCRTHAIEAAKEFAARDQLPFKMGGSA